MTVQVDRAPQEGYHRPSQETNVRSSIERLEAGDRVSRVEFERRYEGDPRKLELIEGVVYVSSPS